LAIPKLARSEPKGASAVVNAAIYGEPRSASVEARSSCVIASMSAKEFRKLFVTQAVLKGLGRNIQSLTKRVYEFSALASIYYCDWRDITAIGESRTARGQ
jgi:hypothetical protein